MLSQTRSWFGAGQVGRPASAGGGALQLPWKRPPRAVEPTPGKPQGWVPFPRVPFPVSKAPVLSPKDKALQLAVQVRIASWRSSILTRRQVFVCFVNSKVYVSAPRCSVLPACADRGVC